MDQPYPTFKIVLCGDAGVGKVIDMFHSIDVNALYMDLNNRHHRLERYCLRI